jgi:ABC-type amino acid transport substrate-binding protein
MLNLLFLSDDRTFKARPPYSFSVYVGRAARKRARLLAAALVFFSFFAVGCSASEDPSSPADVVRQEETTRAALADGKIVVASNVAYPPFEFAPREGPKGFDIDLMNEGADRTGLEVEYRNVQFDSLLRGLILRDIRVVGSDFRTVAGVRLGLEWGSWRTARGTPKRR